ncbi:hypothetical protein LSTR_LSTR012591 [Laodelphax striatellus]|uniref:Uncharacterized protein n=1 Tax=Laodelphax striatellus TaxID=195883 RepID=A0A482X453_LAOST|nr:hypothetical protein LSTR_LSTR012591 [Laodelphax striatellus]
MVGIEAQSEENGQKRWPTPFLYPIPQTYSSSYVVYTYTLHIILLAPVSYQGYLMITSVTLSTEKVLADFETMYMLIELVTKDFHSSSRNSYRESHRQLVYEETNIGKSEANLRVILARIVRCHQIIHRKIQGQGRNIGEGMHFSQSPTDDNISGDGDQTRRCGGNGGDTRSS